MLVLTRRVGESLVIGDNITVVILSSDDGALRLGISAPREVEVHREEVYRRIRAGDASATHSTER
jgi:carbon storage regulator